ncbi:MAG: hypothetical protein IPK60_08230 [Sandaracinaceae bacterium]|nr:hypothetical protein [Sandaracinaceae bacterium]
MPLGIFQTYRVLPVLGLVLAACGEATPQAPTQAPTNVESSARAAAPTPPPPGFPTELVTEAGIGPALYMGPGAAAPTVGYVSQGVVVSVAGAPEGDRVPVRIRGPLKVRAWMPLARLAGQVTRRGRVRGAPVAVRPGDRIGIRGQRDENTLIVSVRPNLGASISMDPFEGDFPAAWISAPAEAPVAVEEAGETGLLAAGDEVPVYDRPQGTIVARVPRHEQAIPVQIARRQGEWSAVRIGFGPYLVGYVRAPIQAGASPTQQAPAPVAQDANTMPERIQNDAQAPLIRVRVGARIRFGGTVLGIVDRLAYARVLHTYPNGDIDVFVAADNELALRGIIRAADVAASAPPLTEPVAAEDAAP